MSDTTGSNSPSPSPSPKKETDGGGSDATGSDPAQMETIEPQQMPEQKPASSVGTVSEVAPKANTTTLTGSGTGGRQGVKSTQYIRRGEEGYDGGGRTSVLVPPVPGAGPRYVYRDFSHLPKESAEFALLGGDATDGTAVPSIGMAPTIEEIKNAKLPAKLNHMLMDPSLQNIVSWMPHGRAWKILRPKDFTDIVLPRYFESVNYNSFVRLVNAWGFRRFSTGRDSNAYYHELFLKGMPHLHSKMRRLPKRARKAPISREDEPDFYALDRVAPLPGSINVNLGPGAMPPSVMPGGTSVGGMQANVSSTGSPGMSSPSPAMMNEMAGMGGMGGMGQMPGQMNPMMMQNMMMNPMMFGQGNPMMMSQLNPMMMPGAGGMMGMGTSMGMGQYNPMMMPGLGQMPPSGEMPSLDGSSVPGAAALSASGDAGGDGASSRFTAFPDAGTLEDQRLQARLALMRDERNLLEQEAALARKIAAQHNGGGPVVNSGATASNVPAPSDSQPSTDEGH